MSVPIRAYAICSLLGLALPASADEVAQQSSTGTPVEEILEVIQEDPFADAVVVIAEVYSEELLAEFRALWEFMALDADDIVNLGHKYAQAGDWGLATEAYFFAENLKMGSSWEPIMRLWENAHVQEWYVLAADLGMRSAQYSLAEIYRMGLNGRINVTAALELYHEAANNGHVLSQAALANLYRHGELVLQDYSESFRWYREAARLGDVHAQYMLAVIYVEGEGVLQDFRFAHMWANIASVNRHWLGTLFRDRVAERMNVEQILEAQLMARECMASQYLECD